MTSARPQRFAYPPRLSRVRFDHGPRTAQALWEAVDDLVEHREHSGALESSGLHLLAARRRRALGRPIDPQLADDERRSASARLFAVPILSRVRATLGGALILVGGPELGELYPSIEARPLLEMTLLTDDVRSAAQRLALTGFRVDAEGDAVTAMLTPTAPSITLRTSLPWLEGRRSPGVRDLFATSLPAPIGVGGILTPAPAAHALLLAVASRASGTSRAVDLLDVAALMTVAYRGEVERLARSWHVLRPWRETVSAIEALLGPTQRARAVVEPNAESERPAPALALVR